MKILGGMVVMTVIAAVLIAVTNLVLYGDAWHASFGSTVGTLLWGSYWYERARRDAT